MKTCLRAMLACWFGYFAFNSSVRTLHASTGASAITHWVAPTGSDTNSCTADAPCRTIGHVLQQKAVDGDAVMVQPGIYREQLTISHRDLTLEGVGDGVFILGSFVPQLTAAEGMYKATWPWGVSFKGTASCNTLTGDVALSADACNTLGFWQNQTRLEQVFAKSSVTAGKFYYDFDKSELWLEPVTGSTSLSQIEGLAHEYVVKLTASSQRVTLKNLNIWYGASKPDDGILRVEGVGHTLEDVHVRYSAGAGILVYGADQVAMNNVQASDHGQNGWRVRANVSFSTTDGWILHDTVDELVLAGSGSRRNGWKGYDNCWAGGGTKFSFTTNLVLDGFYSADNNGPGIWLDIENYDYSVRQSMSARDAGRGIFVEYVSDRGVVENNVIFATRDAESFGCAQSVGLVASDSRNVVLSHNTVYTTDTDVKGMQLKTGCATCRSFPYPSEFITWQDNLIVNKNSVGFVRDLAEGSLSTFTFIGTVVEEEYSGDSTTFTCWDSLGSCTATSLGIEKLPPGAYLEDEQSECGFAVTNPALAGKGAQAFVHPRAMEVCGEAPPAESPSASFTFDTNALEGSFTDTSTDDGIIVDWGWDFGDGNGSAEQHPIHTYPSAGVYTVSLTVTDDDGFTGVARQEVNIEEDAVVPKVMVVDAPQRGATVSVPFALVGWAIDGEASTGTGVDEVRVWAFPSEGNAIFLGSATLGIDRPGVGAAYGAQFTPSGYQLDVTTQLPRGSYTLWLYARSTVTGTFNNSRSVDITVGSPLLVVDAPQPGASVSVPFALVGWAVDRAASNGTGIDAVHVWAFPPGGDNNFSEGNFLGVAQLGIDRPGVGAAYGAQFTPSGYQLNVTTPLPQGTHRLRVYARSTVTGTFNNSWAINIAVGSPLLIVDAPQPGASVSLPFAIAGWAIDRAASTGTGIDTVQVWAFPPGGDNNFSEGIFLGVAQLGIDRPGVGAAYGAQFAPSGYQLNVTTPLPQGTQRLRIYARSTVSGTFNNSWAVNITVAP